MKYLLCLLAIILLFSCWRPRPNYYEKKVWGNKPVYATEPAAKLVKYSNQPASIRQAGNIYAYRNYIFQIDVGRGIHVINNAEPSKAERIGFITVNGCAQISIKGSYLYTNSLDDLITLDISDIQNLKEVSRVKDAFPDFRYYYYLVQPDESGYYVCPHMDSVVIGWEKDSIYPSCYKN